MAQQIIVPANFVKAASMFAGSDQTRPILTGIHFAHEDGKLVIVSTDSYRMFIGEVVAKDGIEFEPFTLPAKALAGIKATGGEYVGNYFSKGYVIEVADDGITANVTGDFGRTFTQLRLLEGKYPDFRRIFPKDGEQFTVEPTAINAAFMADACKALTVIDKNAKPTLATRTHKANVLELKGDYYKAAAIVMPVAADKGALAKYTAAPQGDAETQKKLADAAARIAELERDYELAQKHYMEAVESVKRLEDDKQYWMEKAERYEDVGETYYLKYEKLLQEHEELMEAHAQGEHPHEWESKTLMWFDHEVEGATQCRKKGSRNYGNWFIKKQ